MPEAPGRPLTVGIVQTRAHPSSSRYAQTIAAGLDAQAFLPSIHEPPTAAASTTLGGRLHHYRSRWISQPRLVRGLRSDVLHLVDDNGQLAPWVPRDRTVVTCHDLTMLHAGAGAIPYDGPGWYVRRFRWGLKWLPRAARVVCPSVTVGREVVELVGVPARRVVVIPHGVGPQFTPLAAEQRGAVRRRLGLAQRSLVLQVDTGSFYKNAPCALRVTASLRSGGRDVALLRVGPPLADANQALARRLGLTSSIVELGAVSEERLVELYGAADLLLFPSFSEGFGWPVLEAMACGLPIVISDIPVLVELTAGASVSASPHDPGAMAAAVEGVLASRDVQERMRTAGLERAAEHTWERALASYASVYCEVAAEAGPAAVR